jgi:CDP-diacylglycerol--glycerol-3-phosphate 3-phosphatidyltransferase
VSEVRTTRFGPSALATPANALSLARVLAAPGFGVLLARTGPDGWLLWALWTLLAFSDRLDGALARRHGTTRSGAFLDPLADKLLVLAALGALGALGTFPWWPIALIAARETSMSAFRTYAGRRGVSIPARPLAKVKTLAQDLAVGFAVWPLTYGVGELASSVLWLATLLTVVTGFEYVVDGRRLMRQAKGGVERLADRHAA